MGSLFLLLQYKTAVLFFVVVLKLYRLNRFGQLFKAITLCCQLVNDRPYRFCCGNPHGVIMAKDHNFILSLRTIYNIMNQRIRIRHVGFIITGYQVPIIIDVTPPAHFDSDGL